MTPLMVTAICGGLATLIGAFTTMVIQLRGIHKLVNSKMTEATNEITALRKLVNADKAVKISEDSKEGVK